MHNTYWRLETYFERLTEIITKIIGNSLTFLIAVVMVIIWILNRDFETQNIHDVIGDTILSITFLTLFILQKALNRFTASMHLKLNELVATHETASNLLINVESKSEQELKELSKEFHELALIAKAEEEIIQEKMNVVSSQIEDHAE
jgi:low affinity Fe/Cu permease